MKVTFDNVVPIPLEGVIDNSSNIWGTKAEIDTSLRTKVSAPSGRGKSTFLHCIYGMRNDYSGTVAIDGNSVKEMSPTQIAEIRRDKFSIIFQDLRLFLELTAKENLLLKSALYGQNELSEEVLEMVETLGVSHVLDKTAKYMSYGERQRISIVRSLIPDFNWLMMDEPFSHLDEGNIEKACNLIQTKCKERNAGYIIVSLGYDYNFEYDQNLML